MKEIREERKKEERKKKGKGKVERKTKGTERGNSERFSP
jgi:stalled ribosome alternative rescue factor ArfA